MVGTIRLVLAALWTNLAALAVYSIALLAAAVATLRR